MPCIAEARGPKTLRATDSNTVAEFEPIDQHSILPLFLQVVDRFETALRTGRLRPGQMLPRESDLCAQFGVSRKTLRRATDHLAKLAMIRRLQGVGTVVAEEARVDALSARRSLHANLLNAHPLPDTHILSQVRIVADVEFSRRTGFHVGVELLHVRRRSLAGGKPCAILEDLVPTIHIQEIAGAEAAQSFLELLRRRARLSSLIRQEIEARPATSDQAVELGIADMTPLLCEIVSNFDDTGEILHRSTNYYHPVNYRMTTVALPDPREPADQPRRAAAGDWR